MVDQISAGLALKFGRALEMEFDLSWVLWSQMDSFTVDYAQDTFFRSFWSGYSSIDSSPDLRNTLTL